MNTRYMEMCSPGELKPARSIPGLRLQEVVPRDGAVNQRYYRDVGGAWKWTERAEWAVGQWNEYLDSAPLSTVVLEWNGDEIGYSEILNKSGDVEIVNFGLLEQFIGKGLGGAGLVEVVHYAWGLPDAHRVWLHTCDNDHRNALNNYQRRGFQLYRTEES